jgi:hypothetical protein
MVKGAIFTKAHKENLSKAHMGQVAWNKGLKGKQEWMNISGLKSHEKGKYHHSKETKEKMRLKKIGRKFSEKHKESLKKSARRGSLNNRWKGGITSENQKIRDSEEYKIWRIKVFNRDKFTCQKCFIRGGWLEAHHIENFNTNKELRTDTNNGITFCKKCHKLFHHIYGYKNDVNQLTEFLK